MHIRDLSSPVKVTTPYLDTREDRLVHILGIDTVIGVFKVGHILVVVTVDLKVSSAVFRLLTNMRKEISQFRAL